MRFHAVAPLAIAVGCLVAAVARDGWSQTAEPASTLNGNADSGIFRLPPVSLPEPVLATPADDEENRQTVGSAPGYFHWRDRPLSGGYQLGWLIGGPFGRGNDDIANGFFLAKRYGWDVTDYWGLEGRLSDAWMRESKRFDPAISQTEQIFFFDLDLLYYPLGDARLRPYFTLGAGAVDFRYLNDQGHHVHRVFAGLPYGGGVKYAVNEWLVVRAELIDNFAVDGSGRPAMDNLSLTAGGEIRIGDLRKHLPAWLRRKPIADESRR
jgi:Outer membrane protein beta-barrel domain